MSWPKKPKPLCRAPGCKKPAMTVRAEGEKAGADHERKACAKELDDRAKSLDEQAMEQGDEAKAYEASWCRSDATAIRARGKA